MGGFGSTRWWGTSTKDTVEDARSLDANKLNKAGCLRPGYWGGWQWTCDGERVADIGLRAKEHRLILSYRIQQHDGEWRDVEQPTLILWVACRFGGRRPYFLCPGQSCGRRVAKLYGAGTYFLCRRCYRLAYGSQRENRLDRALRRADKILMRLGGEPGMASPFPERPKGMHHRTYQRLWSKACQAEMRAEERLTIFLERLQRGEGRRRVRVGGRSGKEFWT